MPRLFDLTTERSLLRSSIAITVVMALIGVGFGLFSGSAAIVFDGVYSLLDAGMSLLSLLVVNLVTSYAVAGSLPRKLRERFSMGFWHLEPMVLALNGVSLIVAGVYALVTAISSLLSGGRDLEFSWAILYAALAVLVAGGLAVAETRANRRIGSEFVALDIKSWIMSGSISLALLIAFGLGIAIEGSRWAWISPYIDPAVLALVSLFLIPLPIPTVRQALSEIFLVTPVDLKHHVDTVAQVFRKKHGFLSYRAYVTRVGRSRQIEIYFILPADAPARTIGEYDALRDEIGDLIGEEGPNRWLTVVFTGDLGWAE